MTLDERFWSKVDRSGECWMWLAHRDRDGYGTFKLDRRTRRAHQVAYELLVGLIPDDLQLDHLCRVRGCVRPDHLEPVTCRENLLRGETLQAENAGKTHCKRGHLFDEANTRLYRGGRVCRACDRARLRDRRLTRAA